LRALRDPDAFMPSDLVVLRALSRTADGTRVRLRPRDAELMSQSWRPWRSYALQHLWTQEVYA
jgi:3-methyladenine DNA glycosylase/8-oxoguanine DNA glycosylase